MVLLTDKHEGQGNPAPEKRLTIQTVEIAEDTTAIRSLDWDRDRFDIEFGLQNGTTYNSFLIRGEQIALVDTSHEKFRQLYFDTLTGLINPEDINFLIISHTEPDHSGLVKDLLQMAPDITVVGSKVAIQFLEDLVHRPFKRRIVKNGDRLDLGNGHEFEFVIAPNLHWPDTIFSFDHKTQTLFTCDAFGLHYCTESTFDDDLAAIEEDFKYYYDCLMGPNSRSVLSAMKRMAELKTIKMIATGHGPLLYHNVEELTGRYRSWSQGQTKAETPVGIFYVSEYGYSDRLAQSIANGITKTGVAVEMIDLGGAVDLQELRELVGRCTGIVVGMPPATENPTIQAALSTVLGSAKEKQAIGIFETGGGNDEPTYPILNKFRSAGLNVAFPVIEIRETPTENTFKKCEEAGTDLGQWVTRDKSIKAMKSLGADLDKALGRISGGLYIITAKKGDVSSAMLASWVSQASFKPLGFSIAVAKDRAIESLMQVGDRFVLNVLEEGNYQPLMKHFLKRFAPGADRFEGVKTQPAENGAPILGDALAYMECEVVSRMDCGDHWAVFSTVYAGRVSNPDALTAVHHRKVGNHY
ncbi:flavin reductase [Anabaena cylindrica FACHB-243]|uniref:Flavin reductase domain protein FMN-binding protein n=1 Tax=Anabaena cylindrica (strain ATCC 27899 / PCC 7122) TaxID=272123 RepID=K9ZFS2_ANACC|nr:MULTISPECIES: diflavin flavoprotein [Anabaena]AFZ58073.1 flavin reductase domain protein FMN-binding protein [Anabaena cylindrica PCC 7122]MBD2419152.1 flavin reductase [Anabaena cylindrica FACHB-243]MBY5284027.1 MBL fold metallo-hydrolase [Anabaena sp. CCAP 1446/1C]MBY5306836.1 MBL fold metallo-hydrolase [Anabaena sp. CCAP 1446/1C]MCM2409623.1 diflavin flavoprotein [Anabaena sp. CCAP 1446/1C]